MEHTIKWNHNDECWECPICGGRFGDEELARMFGYTGEFRTQDFVPTHCMDCGILWVKFER